MPTIYRSSGKSALWRDAFTFGHMQLAAHTPDGNFAAAFFRHALEDPAARS
jgi:hypothetical protein